MRASFPSTAVGLVRSRGQLVLKSLPGKKEPLGAAADLRVETPGWKPAGWAI